MQPESKLGVQPIYYCLVHKVVCYYSQSHKPHNQCCQFRKCQPPSIVDDIHDGRSTKTVGESKGRIIPMLRRCMFLDSTVHNSHFHSPNRFTLPWATIPLSHRNHLRKPPGEYEFPKSKILYLGCRVSSFNAHHLGAPTTAHHKKTTCTETRRSHFILQNKTSIHAKCCDRHLIRAQFRAHLTIHIASIQLCHRSDSAQTKFSVSTAFVQSHSPELTFGI